MGGRHPCFGRTGVHRGSAIVPLDRTSSYRLSIVTMLLTETAWPNWQCKYLGVQSVHPFLENGGGYGGLVLQGSGRAILFASSDSFTVRRTV